MNKVFPHIRLHGDKTKAASYIRAGQQLLFKLQGMQKLSGVPILKKTIPLDKYTIAIVQIADGVETIDITHIPPTVPVTEQEQEEREVVEGCPPAFILYARKLFDGTEDKDYLLAYNSEAKKWQLASVDPYAGASNTGYWGLEKGIGTHKRCDIVTWDGQPGGFESIGFSSAGQYYGQRLSGGLIQYDNSGDNGFFIGGYKIKLYGYIVAAGIFQDEDKKHHYYAVQWWGSSMSIKQGTMPGPNGQGEIDPTWTTLETFNYADYADSPTFDERWGCPTGNAFVNKKGHAYIGVPMEKDVVVDGTNYHVFPMCLLKFDMVKATLTIVRDNLDAMPDNSYSGHYSEHDNAGQIFPFDMQTFSSCSDTPDSAPAYNDDQDFRECGGTASYSNKGRPMLLRTFGGLDRLYTYELEVEWSLSSSFSEQCGGWNQQTASCVTHNCYEDNHDVFHTWYYLKGTGSINLNEMESGVTTIYVYDYDQGEGARKVVDSLDVIIINVNINVSQGYTKVYQPLNAQTAASYGVESLGDTAESSKDNVGGGGFVSIIRRQVLDHHPQIKDSWSYIETEEVYDGMAGVLQEKVIRIVQMGKVVDQFTSDIAAAGHMGHEFFDYSVKSNGEGGQMPNMSTVLTIHMYTSYVNNVYAPNWNTFFEGVGKGVSSVTSQDPGILTQQFHGAFRYEGAINNEPAPMRLNGGSSCAMVRGSRLSSRTLGRFALNQSVYGSGKYGHGFDFTFWGGSSSTSNLNSVAVHRPIGKKKVHPYIWIKKKIHYDTGTDAIYGNYKTALAASGQVFAKIVASPDSPNGIADTYGANYWQNEICNQVGEYVYYTIFWTKTFDYDTTEWPALADSGEWYIESNVLTDDQIKKLTEEESLDIIGIGII
jgi:hypothetical protein